MAFLHTQKHKNIWGKRPGNEARKVGILKWRLTYRVELEPCSTLRLYLSNCTCSFPDGCPLDVLSPYAWPESDLTSASTRVDLACSCGDLDTTEITAGRARRVCTGSFVTGLDWEEPDLATCQFDSFTQMICDATQVSLGAWSHGWVLFYARHIKNFKYICACMVVWQMREPLHLCIFSTTFPSLLLPLLRPILYFPPPPPCSSNPLPSSFFPLLLPSPSPLHSPSPPSSSPAPPSSTGRSPGTYPRLATHRRIPNISRTCRGVIL